MKAALQEELGMGGNGKYGAPVSNEHYGSTEAPVIHFNGDPLADMLYTDPKLHYYNACIKSQEYQLLACNKGIKRS